MAVENLESTSVATSKRSGEASKDVRRTCVNSIAIHSTVAMVASHPAKKIQKSISFPITCCWGSFPLSTANVTPAEGKWNSLRSLAPSMGICCQMLYSWLELIGECRENS